MEADLKILLIVVNFSSSPSYDDSHTVLHCMPRILSLRLISSSAGFPFYFLPPHLTVSKNILINPAPLLNKYLVVLIVTLYPISVNYKIIKQNYKITSPVRCMSPHLLQIKSHPAKSVRSKESPNHYPLPNPVAP